MIRTASKIMVTSKGRLVCAFGRSISLLSGKRNQEVVTGDREKPNNINHHDCTRRNKVSSNKRAYSTKLYTHLNPSLLKNVAPLFSEEDKRELMAPFPNLLHDMLDECHFKDLPDVTSRFDRLLHYTAPNTRWATGPSTFAFYKGLERPELLTQDAIRKAVLLSWCVEIITAVFFLADDIMDDAQKRLGIPCWHRLEDVGLKAVNDVIMLEQGLYSTLSRHFSHHPRYVPLMEMFHKATLMVIMGQGRDNMNLKDGLPNFDIFTPDRHTVMLDYKLSCMYELMTGACMYLCNRFDEKHHRQVRSIMIKTGRLVQERNDLVDCFGDPARVGKERTDIKNGKFAWPVVMALQISSEAQRKVIKEHYGRKSDESVAIVQRIFDELNLLDVYAAYEEERLNLIGKEVEQLDDQVIPHELILRFIKFSLDSQFSDAPVLEQGAEAKEAISYK